MICYIIDDEIYAIDTLKKFLLQIPGIEIAGCNEDTVEGIYAIKKHGEIDVVFMDVDMPVLSGLDAIKLLPDGIAIVFTTDFSKYALNAFEHNIIDYLTKPVAFSQLLTAVDKVERYFGTYKKVLKNPTSIFINPGIRGTVQQIHFNEIAYIEGLKNYILIHTGKGNKFITYHTLSDMMDTLPDANFLRIHKSYIVNINKIVSIEGNRVKLADNIILPIGIRHKATVSNAITDRMVRPKRAS